MKADLEKYLPKLKESAYEAMEKAYVPYSRFRVGAAVLTEKGNLYSGCNIENASYGATNCAERTAIFKAVAAGEQKITCLVVVSDLDKPISPCGICRQVLKEFSKNATVCMIGKDGSEQRMSAEELLPSAFTKEDVTEEKHEF
ncbi:MAG TPA: cytidine deaminase [Eubacteriaceae bacterium]|nr:cytidine deaminase [Eubacteriaceae bacterium]